MGTRPTRTLRRAAAQHYATRAGTGQRRPCHGHVRWSERHVAPWCTGATHVRRHADRCVSGEQLLDAERSRGNCGRGCVSRDAHAVSPQGRSARARRIAARLLSFRAHGADSARARLVRRVSPPQLRSLHRLAASDDGWARRFRRSFVSWQISSHARSARVRSRRPCGSRSMYRSRCGPGTLSIAATGAASRSGRSVFCSARRSRSLGSRSCGPFPRVVLPTT